ncbi:MAG: CHASE2:Stage sporulation [Proteobacteria bacterium]|nr:CHASE2:Stage sporulation [Pseudomonadota bacterium]
MHVWSIGRGKPIALILLIAGISLVLFFPDSSLIANMQRALFDQYQIISPRQTQSQPVVIVEIDEQTLGEIGHWPWPRNYTAALIEAIAAHKPAAIGLDIIMPEADHASPQALAESRPDLPENLRAALAKAASNDQMLAVSIARAPVVLGAAGFPFRTHATRDGLRTREVRIQGTNPATRLNTYPYVLASLPEFQAVAKGQALLSSEPDKGVVRRAALLSTLNDAIIPGLALEMLRVAQGATEISVDVGSHGVDAAHIGSKRIPLQANGEAWVHFDKTDRHRAISALSLLKGEVTPERIAGKMVLVGVTGLGLLDLITTPLGDRRAGVDVHAQLIESITDNHFLLRPWWMRWVELGLFLSGGLILIWLVPHVKPRVATLLAGIMYIVLFSTGIVLFRSAGLLLDAASLFAGLNVVFGSLLSSVFLETDRQRRHAEQALQVQREAAARIAGEIEAARRIQLGSLPVAATLFAGETRFEIDALLEPARQVGGDLYDFYRLDEKRLFFVVGDVSGKGLPASLFMAVTKALAKSAALRGDDGIGVIVATATRELARENPEMFFVTMIAGILDLETGALEWVNAGHDAPWRLAPGGRISRADGAGGPPLCVLHDFTYPVEHLQMEPGETLCVVTDGITEAMDNDLNLYGNERVASVLTHVADDPRPAKVIAALREDVRQFVGDAEASDDLTLLALRWFGSDRTMKGKKNERQ